MAKQFKDFKFMGKKLSDLLIDYVGIDFDGDSDKNLAMSRSMEIGETNRYKTEANHFYDTWDDAEEFQLHIVKDPCKYLDQEDLEIKTNELREFTRWLTSEHYPNWLYFKYDEMDDFDEIRYKGWFSNIETWTTGGKIYGLILSFKCTSPFAYTGTLKNEFDISGTSTVIINCDSDELNSYTYPKITFKPHEDGYIYILSRDDANVISTLNSESVYNQMTLYEDVEEVMYRNGYDIEEIYKQGSANTVYLDGIGMPFYMIDKFSGERTKAFALLGGDGSSCTIISNGFMYMELYKDLDITMDCSLLTIKDSIGRMVLYKKLGIEDVDNMYWLRFKNGNNILTLHGNCEFTFEHIESRKVGE